MENIQQIKMHDLENPKEKIIPEGYNIIQEGKAKILYKQISVPVERKIKKRKKGIQKPHFSSQKIHSRKSTLTRQPKH
jgi:hypothetical protein